MSRKYMNDRWCVRCGRQEATPYLRKHWKKLEHNPFGSSMSFHDHDIRVVDIGCGNGRNSEFMKEKGFQVVSLDMGNDYGSNCLIDGSPLPLFENTVDVILVNFLFMFLKRSERKRIIKDLKKSARGNCTVMVELYPAKDSETKTEKEMIKLQKELFDDFGWEKVLYSKGRFIAKKVK